LVPVANAAWKNECGSCHLAYHPGLLPERSWRALMGGLERHFGESAGLDAAAQRDITAFLAGHSADRQESRRSAKILASLAPGETPLRISQSPWFLAKHRKIAAPVWQRSAVGSAANCLSCHPGAELGDFAESRIRIPS
jgi:hypothetical protein